MSNAQCTCTVEVSPDEADAGTDFTLKVEVAYSGKGSLRAPRVSIRDGEGAELAQAELTKAEEDDETYVAEDVVVPAPRSAGEHVYRAVVLAPDKDGALQEQASSEVKLIVKAHEAALNIWDTPSAVVAGSRFKFMVGVRCSAGCCLAGQGLGVFDQQGSQIGTARLGSESGRRPRHCMWPRLKRKLRQPREPINGRCGPLRGSASSPMTPARLPSRCASSPLLITR